jgi:hypothetical protein
VLEILISAIEGENIKEIPYILTELSKCFMAPFDYGELEVLRKKYDEIISRNTISRSDRKDFTAAVKLLQDTDFTTVTGETKEEDEAKKKDLTKTFRAIKKVPVEQLKKIIKRDESRLSADAVVDIGYKLISLHQHDPLSAISKTRKKGQIIQSSNSAAAATTSTKGDAEGARVKEAMRDLRILNHLIALKESVELLIPSTNSAEIEEKLTEYQATFTNIIRAAYPSTSRPETIANNFSKILRGMGIEAGIDKKSIETIVTKDWIKSLDFSKVKTESLGKLANDIFDFEYVSSAAISEQEHDYENLKALSARTIVCIFSAFKHLGKLPENVRKNMIEDFADKICSPKSNYGGKVKGGQGWHEYKFPDPSLAIQGTLQTLPINLNKDLLAQEINGNLTFLDGKYSVLLNTGLSSPSHSPAANAQQASQLVEDSNQPVV